MVHLTSVILADNATSDPGPASEEPFHERIHGIKSSTPIKPFFADGSVKA